MLGQARAALFKVDLFKVDLPGIEFFKTRAFRVSAVVAVVALGLVTILVSSVLAQSYTVNSTGDAADASSTDNACDTNLATPEHECTLRAAIQQSNAVVRSDEISFNIPETDTGRNATTGVFTIKPTTALPAISDAVTINGYSQPGASENTLVDGNDAVLLVELSGAGVTPYNYNHGLRITGAGSTVKGLVINGFNSSEGVYLDGSGATANKIQGNIIGANAAGDTRLPNSNGVHVYNGASNNQIGGALPSERNVISGNNSHGIYVYNTNYNKLRGNFVGTNKNGTGRLHNGSYAVYVYNSGSTAIGEAGAGNVISGNNNSGVWITGGGNNSVQGNRIGTNAAGTGALGNSGIGVYTNATNTTIGGTDAAARNVISANTSDGVHVAGGSAGGAKVQGNYVGTNKDGTRPTGAPDLGNGSQGVYVGSVSNVSVGGAEEGAGNVISDNSQSGIYLTSGSANRVQGNLIGLDAAGNRALGNSQYGVYVYSSHNNLVGGRTAAARNVVSGNGFGGIYIYNDATGNKVEGNYVGTNAAGTEALGNASYGVVAQYASNNTIGGTATGAGNLIAHNVNDGVGVLSSGIANRILSNTTHTNGGLGIDLDSNTNGVTGNDNGDADTGVNNLQNFPVLGKADRSEADDGSTTVTGTLDSAPDATYIVQFFASSSADPTTYGEGQRYLGQKADVTTDSSGRATFSFTITEDVAKGEYVTATATSNPENDTSEFSKAVAVTDLNDPPANTVPGAQSTDEDAALVFLSTGGNGISVADPDAGSSNPLKVTLGADNGTLTLGGASGLTFTTGDGTGDADMTFTGTIADINAALDGLKYEPIADYSGSASLTITTDDGGNTGDGGAKSDTDTVSITVNPANDLPTISDVGNQSTNEDTVTSPIDFTVGDEETAAGSLTVTGSSSDTALVPNENIAFGGSGENRTVTITPADNKFGTATITLTVTDADGGTSSDEFVLTVNPTDEAPDAVNDAVTMNQDTTSNVDVLANDDDPDGDQLTISGVSTPGHGTATVSADNKSISYTPSTGYVGADSFTYTISDGNGGTDTATVNVTVRDVVAPLAPRITSPANNSYDTDGDVTVSGTAEAGSTVELFLSDPFDGPISQGKTKAGDNGKWSITVSGLEDDSYTFAARATDAAGNTSRASRVRTVIVDTEAPSAPRVTRPANESYDPDGSFTVTGTAEPGSFVDLFDGSTLQDEAQANDRGRWSVTLTEVPEGRHNYTATVTDAAGNVSPASNARTVVVDKTRPTVSSTDPRSKATGVLGTTNVKATFSEEMDKASVEAPGTVKLARGTTPVPAAVTYDLATKTVTLDPTANLAARTVYTATISTAAKDLAGNSISANYVWTFTTR